MNCKNCNSELPENTLFCPVCGERCDTAEPEPVSQESEQSDPVQEEPAVDEKGSYLNFEPSGGEQKEPKKGKGKKIAAIVAAVVVVLVVGIGVTAYAKISNFVRKSFSSPVSYYQYVEKKNRDESSNILTNYYETLRESVTVPQNQNVSYKLELGQSLKTMLSLSGMDFSALNNVEFNMNSSVSEDVISAQIKGRLNDADAITLNMYMDYAKKEGFFQMPELSEKYVDLTKVLQDEEMSEMFSQLGEMNNMKEYFPETKQIDTLIDTYTGLFIDEMDTVEKSSADLEAAGVKANYTDLKVTCKGKKIYSVILKMMTTMKDDQNIKAIVEKIDKEAYTEFTDSLSEGIDQMKAQESEVKDEDVEIVMDVYVDGDGGIVGRIINVKADENTIKITCAEPQKGSEFGSTVSVEYNGVNYFTFAGKGTRSGGKVSGDFTLSMDDSFIPSGGMISSLKDFLTIKVTDLDEDTLEEEGYLNGNFSITSKAIASFTSYEIQLDCKGDKKESTWSLSVVCGGDKLATLTALSKEGEEVEGTKPGEGSQICDASDQAAFEAYMSELDADKLLASIKEKCGVDLSTYVTMLESLLGDNDDYDDYDTDDYDTEDYDIDDYDAGDYELDEDALDGFDYDLKEDGSADDVSESEGI